MQELRWLTLVLLLCLSPLSWSADRTQCSAEDLRQKNCLLKWKQGQFLFLKQNLSIDDGIWKSVEAIPHFDEKSEWISLRLFRLGGRKFYELKYWAPPTADVQLQSLHWLLVELKGENTVERLDQVIQKRRAINKDKFLEDALEPHKLTVKKKSEIHWQVGHQKGHF